MTQKYALYSEDAVGAVLSSLALPVLVKTLAGGATYNMVSVGAGSESIDGIGQLYVERSDATTTQILVKLPETPLLGQLLAITYLSGTPGGTLRIERFDANDSINGSSNVTLRTTKQSVLLQARETTTPGYWSWVVLATYSGQAINSIQYQAQWGAQADAALAVDDTRYLPVQRFGPSVASGSAESSVLFCPDDPQIAQLAIYVLGSAWSAGTLVVNIADYPGGAVRATATLLHTDSGSTLVFDASALGFGSIADSCVCEVIGTGMTATNITLYVRTRLLAYNSFYGL